MKTSLMFASIISLTMCKKATEFKNAEMASIEMNAISCDRESTRQPLTFSEGRNASLPKSCSTGPLAQEPLDIVFVIDMTESMQPYLDVVKNSVVELASLLQAKGSEARFGAVGFRDTVDKRFVVPLGSAEALRGQLIGWIASGGEDDQEAGQSAIREGLLLLGIDTKQKAMLYISDAMAFNGGDHSDFSTRGIADSIAAYAKSQRFAFYSSVCHQSECNPLRHFYTDKRNVFATPREQMDRIISEARIPDQSLDFPFSKDVLLKDFAGAVGSSRSCSLQKVTAHFKNGQQTQLSLKDGGEAWVMTLPPKGQLKALQMDRCCDANCQDKTQVVVDVRD